MKSLSHIWPFNISFLCFKEAFWLLSALGLFIIAQFSFTASTFLLALGYGFFLSFRFFGLKEMILWLFLIVLFSLSVSLQKPQEALPGIYEVTSIRSGYAIAKKDRAQVVIYDTEMLCLKDRLDISSFQTIHSTNNQGLFCFSTYLFQRGIFKSAKEFKKVESSFSWQSILYRKIKFHKASSLYLFLLYGISKEENPLSSLGFPFIALTGVIKKILEKRIERKITNWLLVGLQILLMILFPFQESCFRMLIFSIVSALFTNWNTRFSFQVIAFLLIYPIGASSMSFILPTGLSFFSHFQKSPSAKKTIQIFWCVLCQMLMMGQLNVLILIGFLWMRTWLGWFMLISLPGLWLEEYSLFLEKLFFSLSWSWSWCSVEGQSPFWYTLLIAILFLKLNWKWSSKKMGALLAILCLYPFVWKLDPFFHVYMLDVGQGDATVIVAPFQRSVVMIDAAGRFNHDNAQELFIPFLKTRQIHQLDYLIVSHGDFDHDGAVASLEANFPIKQVVKEFQDIDCSYPFELLLKEREFIGKNEAIKEDENDKSLICAFSYDKFQYLWMGDASVLIEQELLKHYSLKSDVLKLGHHGSKTSSDADFLKSVDPSLALISAGFQNRYGHPSLEVLKELDRLGIDRLNSADHGMVHLFSWHSFLAIHTSDGLFAFLTNFLKE